MSVPHNDTGILCTGKASYDGSEEYISSSRDDVTYISKCHKTVNLLGIAKHLVSVCREVVL